MDEGKRKISDREKAWVVERFSERLPQFGGEIMWSVGAKLPKGKKRPPKWLKRCILKIFFGNKQIPKLTNDQFRKLVRYVAGAFEGLTKTTEAALTYPTDEEKELERLKPEIRELRLATRAGIKKMLKKKEITAARSLRPTGRNAEEWNAYFEGGQHGSTAVVEADAPSSISDEILWFMWIFWPEAEQAASREKLHAWINTDMQFVECDFKIFEKVCRQIRFRSVGSKKRMRGGFRAKKRPTS
jgi:hypothetical protein